MVIKQRTKYNNKMRKIKKNGQVILNVLPRNKEKVTNLQVNIK